MSSSLYLPHRVEARLEAGTLPKRPRRERRDPLAAFLKDEDPDLLFDPPIPHIRGRGYYTALYEKLRGVRPEPMLLEYGPWGHALAYEAGHRKGMPFNFWYVFEELWPFMAHFTGADLELLQFEPGTSEHTKKRLRETPLLVTEREWRCLAPRFRKCETLLRMPKKEQEDER